MKPVYIYGLRCPIDESIRYIGRTSDLNRRLSCHLTETGNHKKFKWIQALKAIGFLPKIEKLREVLPEENANEVEYQFIHEHQDTIFNVQKGPSKILVTKEGKLIAARIPVDLADKLESYSKQKGYKKKDIINKALTQYLNPKIK